MLDVQQLLTEAVQQFWQTRSKQSEQQQKKDAGNRGAVTGGKHADGFVRLVAEVIADAGVDDFHIHTTKKRQRTLPGFFRISKDWDVVVTVGDTLLAAVEIKSQVGSFGNNCNNRIEEAIGNAADFWAAFEGGLYSRSPRPWLGYFLMLEEHPQSVKAKKRLALSPFEVDSAFQTLSYAGRYEELCQRLVHADLYNSACLILSNKRQGAIGKYREPDPQIGVEQFAKSLQNHLASVLVA